MITIGLCLIYYGIALWGYQLYGWWTEGEWTSYQVIVAWKAFFGVAPDVQFAVIAPLVGWFMTWPLSLALVLVGGLMLLSVAAVREFAKARLRRLRLKWVAQQAVAAGYKSWTVDKTVSDFDRDVIKGEEKSKTRFN